MPPRPIWTRLVVLVATLAATSQLEQIQNFYQDRCANLHKFESNMPEPHRMFNRGREIGFGARLGPFMDYINRGGSSPFFKEVAYFTAPTVILIIITVFTGTGLAIFLFHCDRWRKTHQRCSNGCFFVSGVFLVIFLAFVIACFVMIVKTSPQLNAPKCEVARVFSNFVTGADYESATFGGFENLLSILADLSNSMSSFRSLAGNFEQLYNANLEASALPALQSLIVFSENYRREKTNDGWGKLTHPTSIRSLTFGVSDALYAEFSELQRAANAITSAAEVGMRLTQDDAHFAVFNKAIDNLKDQILELRGTMGSRIQTSLIYIIGILQLGSSSLWGVLTLGIISAGLAVVALIFIWFQQENKLDRCRTGVKIMLVIISGIVFILAVLLLFFVILSVSVTTACQAIPGILDSRNVIDLFYSWGVNVDSLVTKVAQNCLAEGAPGTLNYLVNDTYNQLNPIFSFLNGVSLFYEAQKKLGVSQTPSPEIDRLVSQWLIYSQAIKLDQPQAASALSGFNNITACSSTQYRFNALNCSGLPNCLSIIDMEGFIPPGCVDSPEFATFTYNNLKAFLNDELNLMNKMINDLSGSSSQSPLSLIGETKNKFLAAGPSFTSIFTQTGNFLRWLPPERGFIQNMDCRVLRQTVLNLEDMLCFRANNNLVYFVIFLSFTVVSLYCFTWSLCITMTCMDRLIEDLKIHQDSSRSLSAARMLGDEQSQIQNEKDNAYANEY